MVHSTHNLFETYLFQTGEYGVVDNLNGSMVSIEGLPNSRIDELVIFESGAMGYVFSLAHGKVQVLFLTITQVKKGEKVVRTNSFSEVPVGHELLGQIITPLGKALKTNGHLPRLPKQRTDSEPLPIHKRTSIESPLYSGFALIDLLVPLGKGQKQLIIGERKTGKTSFVLSTIRNHIAQGGIAIYAAIGSQMAEIKQVYRYFTEHELMQCMVFIATSSHDTPGLIIQSPYAAMTLAEYFRDEGHDVLVVLDNLLTHAQFYREVSLLSERFPGRDSYPGDIFYVHAKLLERTGSFKHADGKSASITCLPIVNIMEGDFTNYIATNIMSMTDGHIYFDIAQFNEGKRPAVNTSLSVTRVGKQVQPHLLKEVNSQLYVFLNKYNNVLNLSHFGAEMNDDAKKTLQLGDVIQEFLYQEEDALLPITVQVLLFGIIWFDLMPKDISLNELKKKLLSYEKNHTSLSQELWDIENLDSLKGYVTDIYSMLHGKH